MTRGQYDRATRRLSQTRREAAERRQAVAAAVALALLLFAYGLAGAADLADRSRGLGASMMPDAEWLEVSRW